ncbi:hypothetical protein BDA99DRAFT_504849 [Phascolomyces articulosus]|uniref:Uncharacterized protein n=1 Tax=Phascolomyces articulosus TaxID=60185 RepID=A0AAD5KEC1_9FUNG|nr:hypothetical protein BDA99DRAFT_504849 [Phascolomyces articulosus]
MSIFMACVHDLLPSQVALCMRHFIDFFMQVNVKEHTDETVKEMVQLLIKFTESSVIFKDVPPTEIGFPKHHALYKYMHDIKQRGLRENYTTSHSEAQHKVDVKRPGIRSNFNSTTFASQIANYILYCDLYYEQYLCYH